MTSFEPEEAQNDSAATSSCIKHQLGLCKCRALLGAFTKYLILVEAYLRMQRVFTYPYIFG